MVEFFVVIWLSQEITFGFCLYSLKFSQLTLKSFFYNTDDLYLSGLFAESEWIEISYLMWKIQILGDQYEPSVKGFYSYSWTKFLVVLSIFRSGSSSVSSLASSLILINSFSQQHVISQITPSSQQWKWLLRKRLQ